MSDGIGATANRDAVDLTKDELDKVGAGFSQKSAQEPTTPRSSGLASSDLAFWQSKYSASV